LKILSEFCVNFLVFVNISYNILNESGSKNSQGIILFLNLPFKIFLHFDISNHFTYKTHFIFQELFCVHFLVGVNISYNIMNESQPNSG